MRDSWILFTATRFLRNRKLTRGLTTALLSSGGIAAGVAALIVVISVMNGFQLGFIDDILEISSFHLRLSGEAPLSEEKVEEILETAGVRSVIRLGETRTLIAGGAAGLESCRILAVPYDIARADPTFMTQLNVVAGSLDPAVSHGIAIGTELAATLAAGLGSRISILTLSGKGISALSPSVASPGPGS